MWLDQNINTHLCTSAQLSTACSRTQSSAPTPFSSFSSSSPYPSSTSSSSASSHAPAPVLPPPSSTPVPPPSAEALSIPTFSSLPSFDALLPLLSEVIISARRIPSSPLASWKENIRNEWSRELTRLSVLLDSAIQNPTPLNLFNTILHLLAAPGAILGTRFKAPTITHNSTPVHSALNKVIRGQERKAFRLLCSNGVAEINRTTVEEIRKLHPDRKEDLKLPSTQVPQLAIDRHALAKKLFNDTSDQNKSKDGYGWAPWLFHSCRAEKKGFFNSFVDFTCSIANQSHLFPPICALLLSGGSLTPLHKLSTAEQKEREDGGLPPKLRPINSGSLISKLVLSSVLTSPAAKRAAERVAPFQLSLGTSRGVEKLIHICRAAHHSRHLVGKNDFENGFNSLSRQRMLLNHSTLFPESTSIFNFFYGVDAPVFLIDSNGEIIVLWSKQGSRQGCSIGTEGFCLGIHPVLQELQKRYPDFEFRLITDDLVPIVPPPVVESNEAWQALYRRYADCLKDIKDLSFSLAGLNLNNDKGALLLPDGAPLPSRSTRARFPVNFDFRQDGMRIVGSPVGTDHYVNEFVGQKVDEALVKLNPLLLLGKKSPQAAHRLLTSCATKLMSFLAATVPPILLLPHLARFDDTVELTFFQVISQSTIVCSRERMQRAALKASLPSPIGCGLTKSVAQSQLMWWASVGSCLQDKLLFSLRYGLGRFTEHAYSQILHVHGGVLSKHWLKFKHMYPDSHLGLLNGTFYSPLNEQKTKTVQVGLKVSSKINHEHFITSTSFNALTNSNNLTHSDVIQAGARTYAGQIFAQPITQSHNRFNTQSYLQYVRFFLGLPPALTIGGTVVSSEFDYPVQKCLAEHKGTCQLLDANGDHASSGCPSAQHARIRKHDTIKRVVAAFAQEAGLVTRCEPDTHSLLLGEFSKADCRRIFPKQMSKAYRAAFDNLSQAQVFIASDQCSFSLDQKRSYIQNKIDAIPEHAGDTKGLRVDVSIENPSTGETKWLDITVAHPSCVTYRPAELKLLAQRRLTAAVKDFYFLQDNYEYDPSPTLLEREVEKVDLYGHLVVVAAKQHLDGKRSTLPSFTPFVASDYGEIAPQALAFQEWLVNQFRLKCIRDGDQSNGHSTVDLVRSFRHRFKMAIQVAIAAGMGNMIQAAGHPQGGRL